MKKGIIAGIIIATTAGAGAILGGLGGKGASVESAIGIQASGPARRAIRLPGTCPSKGKEPARCIEAIQKDGWCLCITTQEPGTVDNEVTAVPLAASKRLVICDDMQARWRPKMAPLKPGCRVACDDVLLPNESMNSIETGIEVCLREICAPCVITAGKWDHCPRCWYNGDCAALCPPPEPEP